MARRIFYFLIPLFILGCSNKEKFILFNKVDVNRTQSQSNISNIQSPEFNDIEFEYKIVPDDRVSVIIYKHPELSPSTLGNITRDRGILVNAKGDIRLPLVKSIHIAGLTQTQAQERIEDSFRRYIKSPDVYFEVLNKRAYVIGEVNKPGEVDLVNEKISLIQLLSKAGDLKDSANRRAIMILRPQKGGVDSEMVNLTDVNSLRTANLMIKPNDIVYVLPNDMKAFNAKVGEINPLFQLINNILNPFVIIRHWNN
jgi:polysaccharide export outer membrane protein